MKEKPFARKPFVPVYNVVFDVIMPDLSPSAFKILCVAIRQTLGWQNKEQDIISYSQFQEKANLARATVARAIQENLEKGYLIRVQVGENPRTHKPIYAYRLNEDFEIDVPNSSNSEPLENLNGSNSEPFNGSNSEPFNGSNSELTKDIHTDIHHHGDDAEKHLPDDVRKELDIIGLNGKAREEIKKLGHEDIRALLSYAQEEARNPAAWVAAWVLNGRDIHDLPNGNIELVPDPNCPKCQSGFVSTGHGWEKCDCWQPRVIETAK
jgi:DNA-binding Lrp family transcriptional regulator